jgi:hypothetical protein
MSPNGLHVTYHGLWGLASSLPEINSPRQQEVGAALHRIWERPVRKQDVLGIHGTLLYQLERYKTYYRAKREDAIDPSAVNRAQRRLFGIG